MAVKDMALLTFSMARDHVANTIPLLLANLRTIDGAIACAGESREVKLWRRYGAPAIERAIAALEEVAVLINQLPLPLGDGGVEMEGEQLPLELTVAPEEVGEEGGHASSYQEA